MDIYLFYYLFFVLLLVVDFGEKNQRDKLLIFLIPIISLFIGFRGGVGGDYENYSIAFKLTPTLFDENLSMPSVLPYSDIGFYYLSIILKSILDNQYFYFFSISLLTTLVLFKILREYSIYPILGYIVYISRYLFLRDFNQIRASLAIVIVIYSIRFIADKSFKKYFIFVIVASFFHVSMLIALPFYAIAKIRWKRNRIILFL